ELARHDGRRHEPSPRDANDGLKGTLVGKAPRQRPRVAMKLIPGHREGLAGDGLDHGSTPIKRCWRRAACCLAASALPCRIRRAHGQPCAIPADPIAAWLPTSDA